MGIPTDWIGRVSTLTDTISAFPLRALAATLDRDDPPAETGTSLPQLWHWLFFLPAHRPHELRQDGHAHGAGFMPPINLPRRMWAGSKFAWERDNPLRVGDVVTRISRVEAITPKVGRSGDLVFVNIRHEFHNASGLSFTNDHTTAFRGESKSGDGSAPAATPEQTSDWQRELVPDEVTLFRYSALTHNTHRIHYDWRHATQFEGYPALVVQGPLMATLLLDLMRRNRPDQPPATLELKALRPAFAGRPLRICGRIVGSEASLWAQDSEGLVIMRATARIR